MNSRERRLRRARRLRRRRAITLAALLFALVVIIALRVGGDNPERDTEAELPEITPTVIAVEVERLPEPTSPPEPTEEPEENRALAVRLFGNQRERHIYPSALASSITRPGASRSRDKSPLSRSSLTVCFSPYFPDTVEEVVFQKYGDVWQFSPAPYLWTAEPGEMQFDAVHTALTSTEYILTADTVYFSGAPYNEHISAIIGGHYFCEID